MNNANKSAVLLTTYKSSNFLLQEARKLTPWQRRTPSSHKPQSVTPSRGGASADRQQEYRRYLGKFRLQNHLTDQGARPLTTSVCLLDTIALRKFCIKQDYFPVVTSCWNVLLYLWRKKTKDTDRKQVDWVNDARCQYARRLDKYRIVRYCDFRNFTSKIPSFFFFIKINPALYCVLSTSCTQQQQLHRFPLTKKNRAFWLNLLVRNGNDMKQDATGNALCIKSFQSTSCMKRESTVLWT